MERVVLYRGQTKENKKWVHGAFVQNKELIIDGVGVSHKVFPETVGEFSNFHDIEGNCIWEWDVCRGTSDEGDSVLFIVKVKDGCFIGEEITFNGVKPDLLSEIVKTLKVEVVGNSQDISEHLEGWKK